MKITNVITITKVNTSLHRSDTQMCGELKMDQKHMIKAAKVTVKWADFDWFTD